MATVSNKNYQDRHPFTSGSTLKLCAGLTLPKDSVISCSLYPICADQSAAYGYISEIGRYALNGFIKISSNNEVHLCTVSFDLEDLSDELVGIAYDCTGSLCGSMVLRHDWLPLFYGHYKPSADALCLTPSACRMILPPSAVTIDELKAGPSRLLYHGEAITAIRAGGSAIKEDASGELYVYNSGQSGISKDVVESLNINGISLSGEDIAILTTGRRLEVGTDSGSIVIGINAR